MSTVTRRALAAWLRDHGFAELGGKATSHRRFRHESGVVITVPGHRKQNLSQKHVGMIVRQLEAAGLRSGCGPRTPAAAVRRPASIVRRWRTLRGQTEADHRRQQPGKIGGELLTETILGRLGAGDPEVLAGPRAAVDVGVLRVAPGVVMAVTTDPVFVLPSLGWEQAAWFAVHILASDAATSGLPLRAMSVDLNLPAELPDSDLATLWQAYAGACEELGIAVVAGHTGRYAGCAWPMVGGATCLAVGPEDRYITPTMARAGDRVVVTKGAAIEAAALLAMSFPDRLPGRVGTDTLAAAQGLVRSMTVVPEARVAAAYGVRDAGVTAMHDATEGGVLGGLYEVAEASGVGLRIDQSAIPVRPEVAALCAAAGIDPYRSLTLTRKCPTAA